MEKFNKLKKTYIDRLDTYVPVVTRVHGESHPEFKEVEKVYNKINNKIVGSKGEKPNLTEEFKALRNITDNYKIPEDTCETYEAVYEMLKELDTAYFE